MKHAKTKYKTTHAGRHRGDVNDFTDEANVEIDVDEDIGGAHDQCYKIGRFLKVLGYKFCCKRTPIICQHF